MAAIKFEHILAAAIGQKWLQSNLSTFWQLLGWNFTHRTKMAAIKFEHILAYFTNWQEITIDMLVRGDAF